ncbi:hypothetical protein [Spiroplasma taiwanense]|uniref:Methyltransferase n=1 Tax=Spiroplasma taiwanense CT-1 TaxID=1276220 RepID=S5MHP1_9MOLU|nr:hypothetical protein [Spiroplasma taiwanense]AGR41385.1 methyltransferase [Spiroplasma taiwanense CT-1]
MPTDFNVGSEYTNSYTINNQFIEIKNYAKLINWVEQYTINEIGYFIDNKLVEKQEFRLNWYGVEEFSQILTKIRYKKQNILLNYGSKINTSVKTITFVYKK